MIEYYICMVLTCFLVYVDTYRRKEKTSIGFWGWIAILIPSLLAAFREIGVGSDTLGYGSEMFYAALRCSTLSNYFNSANPFVSGAEPGFRVLVYLVSRISSEIAVQFFVIEFIIVFFIYKALLNYRLKNNTYIGMLLYFTLFLGFSLNLMRQSIAMAVIFWALKYLYEKKYLTFILIVCLMATMQLTALIALLFVPAYIVFAKNDVKEFKNIITNTIKRYRQFLVLILIAGLYMVLSNGDSIMEYVIQLGLKKSYEAQLLLKDTAGFNASSFILMMLLIAPFALKCKKLDKKDNLFMFIFISLIISAFLWQLSMITQEMYRIALYFWVLIMVFVPKYLTSYRKNKYFVLGYYVVVSNFYFVYYAVVIGANEIYPYAFA